MEKYNNYFPKGIVLKGRVSIEEVFAETEIETLRDAFREAQDSTGKIPAKLKPLISMPDFPQKLVHMLEKAVAR